MRNKTKTVLTFIIVLIFVALIGYLVFLDINNNNIKANNHNYIEVGSNENEFEIRSTSNNPIEKDGIEATNINITILGNQLQIIATLKNNTKEDVNGFFIEIELLDKNGKVITTLSDNSTEVIEAGKSIQIANYVMDLENQDQIGNARIASIEKNSVGGFMEEAFDDMIPDDIEE